jgi:hypothetical protein
MIGRRLLRGAAFGVALVMNPYLGCSHDGQSDFTYSEADMKAALLGTWQGTAQLDGETIAFSLSLEQASAKSKTQGVSAPPVQPQCGSRSFVKAAAACASLSTMPVVGMLTSVSPDLNGAVDGSLVAYRTLDAVELSLRLESGAVLSGRVEDDALVDGRIGASASDSFSLQRP